MTEDQSLMCQKFLKELLSKVNPEDQLPVKVSSSSICPIEVIGAVLEWILQYLNQWNCPDILVSPLAKIILNDIRKKLNDEKCPFYNREINAYLSLPLMQYVVSIIQQICRKLVEEDGLVSVELFSYSLPTAVFSSKNRRRLMEDRHIIVNDLPKLFNKEDCEPISYYAIFDGHNGTGAATYSAAHLHQFLAESQYFPMFAEQALCDAYKKTDENFLRKLDARSGTTAVTALLYHKTRMLYVAWAGDSEALLSSCGRVRCLVNPHKADRKDEIERIKNQGGVVVFWGAVWRVNGQLAITRSIGDAEHKTCVISSPDIVSIQLDGNEDFVILACDGLWDKVTPQEAAKFVYEHVSANPDNHKLTSQLLVELAKSAGSVDNITTIVIFLKDPHNIKCWDIDMETATAESFSSNQNGATNYRPINFGHTEDDDDDFGPETNVDNIDDGLMTQSVATKKSYFNSDTIKTSYDQLQNDIIDNKIDEGMEKGAKETGIETLDNGKNVLSDESDEEEWNYFKGDDNKSDSQKLENSGDISSNEMDYTLNPDAQEFVPVSPKSDRNSSQSPELCLYPLKNKEKLLQEDFVASSPLKGQERDMDNVVVPSLDDFEKEIKKRPSNILPKFDIDEFNAENHEMNNGDGLLEHPFENANLNDTYTSTKAVFGDDSCYANNLKDLSYAANVEESNKGLNEKEDNGKEIEEKTIEETVNVNVNDNDNGSEGAFENEDYPSIVEKEDQTNSILTSSNITYNRDSGTYEPEKEVPKFHELLEKNTNETSLDYLSYMNDSTDQIIQKMTSFEEGPMQSLLITGNDSVISNGVKSPSEELSNSNPFAATVAEEFEKEIAEEKEVKAEDGKSELSGFDPFATSDEFDFKTQEVSPFDDASAPPLNVFKNDVEEPVIAETVEDVEVIPEKKDDMTSQIVDDDEMKKLEEEEEERKQEEMDFIGTEEIEGGGEKDKIENSGSVEEPITSVDMETPFIHECSRLNEKSDSVHQESIEQKHYEDLLPDSEKTVTKESDKLESELRETDKSDDGRDSFSCDATPGEDPFQSLVCIREQNVQPVESKIDVPVDLPVPEVLSNEAEEIEKVSTSADEQVSTLVVEQPESDVKEDIVLAAAAVGAVAAVGVGVAAVAAVQDKKDTKKITSVTKKPEVKTTSKPLTKSPATSGKAKTSTSTTPTLKSSTAPKRPSTTVAHATKTTPVRSTPPARPAAKPTTISRTAAPKQTAPKTSAPKPLTKPASSPLKPKTTLPSTTSPRTANKPLSNGDVSSTTKTATRKLLPAKTTSSISSTTASSKPAVNLATRVSLAPKKPLAKTEPEKPRISLTSKRPVSAPSKITKDSKDITNKQLSTKVPPKLNTLKTESKVNSGLKRITKETAEKNANQSDKNMNGNA